MNNMWFDCALVGKSLLLTDQCCADKPELELDRKARQTCFPAAHGVRRSIPVSKLETVADTLDYFRAVCRKVQRFLKEGGETEATCRERLGGNWPGWPQ